MRILFLSRWFPYPPNNGSKLRIYNLLRSLGRRHEVTLLSFRDQPGVNPDTPEVRSLCPAVSVVPWEEFDPHSRHAYMGLLSMKPRSIFATFSAEMAQTITNTLSGKHYDLVIASQLTMASYHSYFDGVPAIFEEIELGQSDRSSRLALDRQQRFRHAGAQFKLNRYLGQLLKAFHAVTVVSEREQALVSTYFPYVKNLVVIANSVNLQDYGIVHTELHRNRLVFTGSFRYHANYEAMVWFVGEVFPRILEQMPNTQLIITGDHNGLPLPASRNVHLAGYVDDVKSLIRSSAVAIAPLHTGGGTRLKILEAMALGTPVVATSKGAEGLNVQSGEQILLADNPIDFSKCILRLLNSGELCRTIAERARLLVEQKYDWQKNGYSFLRLAESVVAEKSWMEPLGL